MIGRDCTALCRKPAMTRHTYGYSAHSAAGRTTHRHIVSRDNDRLERLPIYGRKSLHDSNALSTTTAYDLFYRSVKKVRVGRRNSFFLRRDY